MKRIIAFIFVAAFMLTGLLACSEEMTMLDFIEQSDRIMDFGGLRITCGGCWGYFHNDGELGSNTLASDRKIYKTAQVEKDLNVDLYTDNNVMSEDSGYYWTLYAAGNLHIDITVQHGTPNPIYNMYKSNMLQPLEYMSGIDLSDTEIYGTPDSRRSVTFGGLTYAYNADLGDDGNNRGFLAYNANHIIRFGVADPQELYEQGKWTFDTFAEMLPNVSDLSDPNNPIYALTLYNDPQMLPFSAVFANGGQVVKQNESGKYVLALEDSEAMTALRWVEGLWQTSDIYQESWPPSNFRNGFATFYLGRTFSIQSALSDDYYVDEFYYIPFPCGPDGEYGVSSGTYASEAGGTAFFNSSDTDVVGQVIDYWFRFDNYPDELAFDKKAYDIENNFWSLESYEHYTRGFEVQGYDYFFQIGDELYNKFSTALYEATIGERGFTAVFDQYTDRIQAALDDSLNK